MSKIKMLKPAITIYGTYNAGQVVNIPDDMATAWVQTGLAEPELSETLSNNLVKHEVLTKQNTKSPTPGSFFCQACLEDKPAASVSPDPRYCQGCYDFLLKEAEMLNPGKRPGWVPKDSLAITRPPPEPLSPPFSASKTNTGEEGHGIKYVHCEVSHSP